MAFLLGVYKKNAGAIADSILDEIGKFARSVSGAQFVQFDDRMALMQISPSGGVSPEASSNEVSTAMIAGRAFFGPAQSLEIAPSRDASLLRDVQGYQIHGLLRTARGNFAGVRYDRRSHELMLLADSLSTRPLYWSDDQDLLVFSSTLGALERLTFVRKRVDTAGLVERVCLGYSLADRTPFAGIRRLQSSEIVSVKGNTVRREFYGSWAAAPEADKLDLHAEAYAKALRSAVDIRLASDRSADAFLSGGLDSRVVVQLLRDAGAEVHAFNFSPDRSQDARFGRLFAHAAQIDFTARPRPTGKSVRWAQLLVDARNSLGMETRPAWSGDGGSVTAGWVYVTAEIIARTRSGDLRGAADLHLEKHASQFTLGDLHPSVREAVDGHLTRAVAEQIEVYGSVGDPARRFFLFLLENDQRRHLDEHFEDILLHGQELWTPFLDSEVLRLAGSVPVDAGIGHGFYDTWFRQLSPVVRSVPWQTYPGHVPCPLPIAQHLDYQWTVPARATRAGVYDLRSWLSTALGRDFPTRLIRRERYLGRLGLEFLRIGRSAPSLRLLTQLISFARHEYRS